MPKARGKGWRGPHVAVVEPRAGVVGDHVQHLRVARQQGVPGRASARQALKQLAMAANCSTQNYSSLNCFNTWELLQDTALDTSRSSKY